MSTNAQGNEITSWAVTYRAELAGKAMPGQAKRGWTMTNLMRKAIRNPARATAVFCLIWPGLMAAQSLGIDSIQPQNPSQVRSSYVLGPDDQIVIRVSELEDINDKPILVDTNGQLYLPLVGPVQVAGLTVQQLRQQLTDKLRKYIKEPAVSISVLEFRSQPVSVLGSVGAPGVLQLRGNKNLYEVLSMAGGIKPDAGNSVRITRRIENGVIPLTGATTDPTGKFSLAEVVLKDVMEAKRPEENIEIKPNDVVSVPKGEMIYVVGEVRVSGGLALGERKTVSILEPRLSFLPHTT